MAIVGAGPVGMALALAATRLLPRMAISLYDARPVERNLHADPRTLALSLGSIQLLRRLDAWDGTAAETIRRVHVSQLAASPWPGRSSAVTIDAAREGVPMLGAVQSYGALLAPLQSAWMAAAAREPDRLSTRFGTPVADLKRLPGGIEVDAGVVDRFDVAVVAEGGVFGDQLRKPLAAAYGQSAWVGTVTLESAHLGVAYERFTPGGPAALLPLPPGNDGRPRAALVWCVSTRGDEVPALTSEQRTEALNAIFQPPVRVAAVGPLKCFELGLNAERTLVEGRRVRIGNAAQTLHPVAGQGLNLGLRDAFSLVLALRDIDDVDRALRHVEWQRAPDRWSMIAATDFLARSFTWQAPGASLLRGLGLSVVQALPPLKSLLARQMMFGQR